MGINDYHDVPSVPPLSGPKNDIALVHQLLISRFAIPETNISLFDSQAAHTGIQKAFAAERVKRGDFAAGAGTSRRQRMKTVKVEFAVK